MTAPHLLIGIQGEKKAVRHLRSIGFRVLDRNVRLGRDEIDIVAYDPQDRVIVFVEVKTRAKRSSAYRPELNITFAKRQKLLRSARAWTTLHGYDRGWRVDVVCVADGSIVDHFRQISFG